MLFALFSTIMTYIGEVTTMTFSEGMTEFVTFITQIIAAWQQVINSILTAGNWILILPVFAYLFVIATSSLRSMYKG